MRRWTLADTPADLIPPHPSSRNAVDALHNLALMAVSCELLGVMEKAQEITLDYLRIRKQFGKLIGSFQALQHQAVNMYIRDRGDAIAGVPDRGQQRSPIASIPPWPSP